MPRVDVQIPTSDGVSNGSLHVPDGTGPWPGVVVFPDAFGLRDTVAGHGRPSRQPRVRRADSRRLLPGGRLGAVRPGHRVHRRRRNAGGSSAS